jgi:16S rRNA (adenine1518-N6/adenine1519-N6)-dimethyltransferase
MIEHEFKKKFGQNFLTDKNLLAALVKDAGVEQNTQVLEIGLGAGALTEQLVKVAQKVVGYEIDTSLQPLLTQKFANAQNLQIVFADALKTPTQQIDAHFDKNFYFVANIPYNITTPLIFKFMEQSTKCVRMALMVQKEVAQRICSKPNSADYGALSVICQHFNTCKIVRNISKKMFVPMPKVDSAFIVIEKTKQYDFEYATLVRASFAMRRKTLLNNLANHYALSKQEIVQIFDTLGFDQNVRAESLSHIEYEKLLGQIKTKLSK